MKRPYNSFVTAPAFEWRDRESIAPASPTADDVSRLVRRAFGMRRYTPRPLPYAAMKLVQVTDSSSVSFEVAARVVEQDPTLAAEVLRIAGSPAYVRGEPPRTVEQAVQRLGFSTLREVATQAALRMSAPHRSYLPTFERLHRHAVATAHLTRVVSEAAELAAADAFLAGLFHDVGLLAALLLLSDVYADDAPPIDEVFPELERIHEHVGWRMCSLWQLPKSVLKVAQHHHRADTNDMTTAVVVIADFLACISGAPSSEGGRPDSAVLENACQVLALAPDELDELAEDSPDLVESLF